MKTTLDNFIENYEQIFKEFPGGAIVLYHGTYEPLSEIKKTTTYFTPSFTEANEYVIAYAPKSEEGVYGHIYKAIIPIKEIEVVDDIDTSKKHPNFIFSPEETAYFRTNNLWKYNISEVPYTEGSALWDENKVEIIEKFKEYDSEMKSDGGQISDSHKKLGYANDLGFIAEHDSIAECIGCGEKFSYNNKRDYILWECPYCECLKHISNRVLAVNF